MKEFKCDVLRMVSRYDEDRKEEKVKCGEVEEINKSRGCFVSGLTPEGAILGVFKSATATKLQNDPEQLENM